MTKPAATRAAAPVAKFADLDSFGSAEVEFAALSLPLGLARAIGIPVCAKPCRSALRLVKYKAEPKPVRRAEGRVPRHSPRIGCGDERIVLRVGKRAAVCWDCWTRVLSRSAGWRRMEEVRPEQRPAAKWKGVLEADQEKAGFSGDWASFLFCVWKTYMMMAELSLMAPLMCYCSTSLLYKFRRSLRTKARSWKMIRKRRIQSHTVFPKV